MLGGGQRKPSNNYSAQFRHVRGTISLMLQPGRQVPKSVILLAQGDLRIDQAGRHRPGTASRGQPLLRRNVRLVFTKLWYGRASGDLDCNLPAGESVA